MKGLVATSQTPCVNQKISQNSMIPAERTMMSKRENGDSRMKSKRYQILIRIGNKGGRRLSMWEEIALDPQEETKEEIIGQAE